jgi:hypothetical protein
MTANFEYDCAEVFYPNGRDGRAAWCFVYEHNGRKWRSITSFATKREAETAGRDFVRGSIYAHTGA